MMRDKIIEDIKYIVKKGCFFEYERFVDAGEYEEEGWSEESEFQKERDDLLEIIESMSNRLKKLEILTKANEYEFKTTTETKLIKKEIKK